MGHLGVDRREKEEAASPITHHQRSLSVVTTEETSSRDDIAATILPSHAQLIDPALDRRVRRKFDLFFIPLMWIGYGLVYYDKVRLLPQPL